MKQIYKKIFLLILLASPIFIYAQHEVSGTVTSADGKKIKGAVVQVKATTISTITDDNGFYTINAPISVASLIISAKDAITVEIPINTRINIDIKLGKEISTSNNSSATTWGKWSFGFNGNINTRFTYISVDDNPAPPQVVGSWITVKGSGDQQVTSISNGFAPAILAFNANTQFKDGTKMSIVVSSWYGLATSKAITDLSPIDMRQIFALISNEKWGAVKFGRDNGLWAQETRLNDISIVGGNGFMLNVKSPGLANPGGCGAGYTFNDRLSQITYFSPKWDGFEMAVGMFNPLDFGTLGAGAVSITQTGLTETNSPLPGIHGKLKYSKNINSVADLTLVSSAVAQKNKNQLANFTSWTADAFAKLKLGTVSLSGYYYFGKGTGIGGYLSDAADIKGNARDNNGGYAQLTYEFGKNKKWLSGVYYGISKLGNTVNDPLTLLASNIRITGIVKYKIYESLMVSTEYSALKSKNHQNESLSNNAFSVGAYLSF